MGVDRAVAVGATSPRTPARDATVDALFDVLPAGCCQWRMLPKEFAPRSTVQGARINHHLVLRASPSAGVIDGQSVKTTRPAASRAASSRSDQA
jgi:transposase